MNKTVDNNHLNESNSPEGGVAAARGDVTIETRDIHKEYRIDQQSVHVLRGISLSIRSGEILAILGHSGVGKSTLLNLLGLLDSPTSGQLIYRGRDSRFSNMDLSALSLGEKAVARNCNLGFVFQFYHLLPDLTVRENVVLPAMIRYSRSEFSSKRAEIDARANYLLEQVGLSDRSDFPPTKLSGGERQRASIARAIFNEPELVLCDEPTGNLDSRTGKKIHRLILELNERTNATFVIVTHDNELASLAHRRMHMDDGKLFDA
jgi:lipoprotein-releasing system ATP-binding protein